MSLVSRLQDFFLLPSGSKPLAAFRIAFGIFAVAEVLCLRPNWLDLLGNDGIVQWVISKELFAIQGVPHIFHVAEALLPWGLSADHTVYLVMYGYVFALIALTFGFFTRTFAVIAWLLHILIWNTGNLYGYGVESFTRVCLFYFVFMPVSEWWALDAPRQGTTASDSWGATLTVRILQLHLCIVYLTSGIAKIQGVQWRDGEAMWRVLCQPGYAQFDMLWLADIPGIFPVLAWSVLFLELGYAVLIWPASTRPFMLGGMIAMHVGIGVFMGLWGFAIVMILMNIGAFAAGTDFSRLNVIRCFQRTSALAPSSDVQPSGSS